ncbi:ABC transporter substrate-binding protein [Streptomyces fuscigenes]|uniref:ABC transporter substrate-binding protein n=1 Tax=Streptomyces fuscigenes TaxID=1528880 RepID=UPI001F48DB98|nr:ABC transporter substrate-binding protein [Streptomyces fuscigenes]MCF3962342.1 ABC transporter substrate-binding protein [Streptomyces fuscigenes]
MRRPSARTAGIAGMCLTLVAAFLAFALDPNRSPGSVSVLVNWTGADLAAFRDDVVTPFEEETGIRVDLQGSSAESQILAADSGTGSPPDVAIVPGPGELAGYAAQRRLVPLDGIVDMSDYPGVWNIRAGGPGAGHSYWVPVKADVKSLVWHAPMSPDQVREAAARPAAWCLGMAAAATSGWPGTDWVEDILLQGDDGPALYDELAAGKGRGWDTPEVRKAFATWRTMVGAGDPARAEAALTTGFAEAAGTPGKAAGCSLEHLPAFARLDPGWQGRSPTYEPSADVIPGARPSDARWEVSGDLAALFRSTPLSDRFMRYMTSEKAQRTWLAEHRAGLSADTAVPPSAYKGDPVAQRLAKLLHEPGARYCWDASDALPPLVRDAFTDAVLRFLADPGSLRTELRKVQQASDLVHRQVEEGGRTVAFLPHACSG